MDIRIVLPPEVERLVMRLHRWLDQLEADSIVADAALPVPPGPLVVAASSPPIPAAASVAVPEDKPAAEIDAPRTQRSPARAAILRDLWPAGVAAGDVLCAVNALPGPPIPDAHTLEVYAYQIGVRRPPGFLGTRKNSPPDRPKTIALPAPPLADPAPKETRRSPPPTLSKARQAQQARDRDAALIAEHVAAHGVTRCPTAIASPVAGLRQSAEDGARLRAHHEAAEETRRAEHQRRTNPEKRRAARLAAIASPAA